MIYLLSGQYYVIPLATPAAIAACLLSLLHMYKFMQSPVVQGSELFFLHVITFETGEVFDL